MRTWLRILCWAVLLASTTVHAEEDVPCEKVESIGAATMGEDRVITMRIRTLPPRIAEHTFTYEPRSKDYPMIFRHLEGIVPGQSKSVKPWC